MVHLLYFKNVQSQWKCQQCWPAHLNACKYLLPSSTMQTFQFQFFFINFFFPLCVVSVDILDKLNLLKYRSVTSLKVEIRQLNLLKVK